MDPRSPGRRPAFTPGPLGAVLLSALGCITVNVYFPEAEIKDAAEVIVDEVRPEEASGDAGAAPAEGGAAPEGGSRAERRQESSPRSLLAFLGPRTVHAAGPEPAAQEKVGEKEEKRDVEVDVKSPVTTKIIATLKARFPKLRPFFEKGMLGEGRDGYAALRSAEGLGLKEKRDLQALLAAENDDRKSLYKEVARLKQVQDQEVPKVGELFSEQWQKKSKTGWWIEPEKGKWVKKPAEKGKEKQG